MKVLVLFGNGGRGKTTTLNLLIELLLKSSENISMDTVNIEGDNSLAIKYKGKIIAITTRGDDARVIKNDFQKFLSYKPDVFICAARSKGATHKYILTLTEEENIFWLSKSTFSNNIRNFNNCSQDVVNYREKQNKYQACEMLNIIDKIIL